MTKTAKKERITPGSAPGLVLANTENDPWLYFEDVCRVLQLEARTLRHLRLKGEGPPFIRVGRRLRVRSSQAHRWFADKFENATP